MYPPAEMLALEILATEGSAWTAFLQWLWRRQCSWPVVSVPTAPAAERVAGKARRDGAVALSFVRRKVVGRELKD